MFDSYLLNGRCSSKALETPGFCVNLAATVIGNPPSPLAGVRMCDTFCEKFTCLPNDNNSFLLSVFYVLRTVQNVLHVVLLNSHNSPKRCLPMGQEVRERLNSLPRLTLEHK